jgi:pyrroline-5-carboxylate reductase
VARENDVLILAVKPMHVSKVTSEIAPIFRRDHLLISIALGTGWKVCPNYYQSAFPFLPPGITIRYIEQLLPSKSRVVRVMPSHGKY